MERLMQQQAQQLLKVLQDLQKVNEKLEIVQDRLKLNEELQRQQVQKQNEMVDELRLQFKNISDNILYCLEPQRQCVGQRLGEKPRKSLETHNDYVKELLYSTSSKMADQPAAGVHELFGFDCYEGKGELPEPAVHGQKKQAQIEEYQEDNPEKDYYVVNDEWNVVGQKGKPIRPYDHADSGASAAESYEEHSTTATGIIANAISQMMSQNKSVSVQSFGEENPDIVFASGHDKSRMRGLQGRSRSRDGRRRNRDMVTMSSTYIPEIAEFCIPNLKIFQAANKPFFTDKFSNNSRACKVRLRLLFNNRGCLEVHLLVSVGPNADKNKWPMRFTSRGDVYNQSSKTYTQLWIIQSQECHMPEKNQEHVLEADVCLSTSRDPCKNVTYNLLKKKWYVADGDRLLLKWNLKKM